MKRCPRRKIVTDGNTEVCALAVIAHTLGVSSISSVSRSSKISRMSIQ